MKILIIQQKMIGDVLTSSILFELIKKNYPKSELHYLINTHTYPVVEHNPFIDHFHFFTPEIEKSKSKLWKLAQNLREEHFYAIIDIYSKFSSNLISLVSNAKVKVSKYKWYSSFIYSLTLKELQVPKTNAGLAIENRIRLLEGIDLNDIAPIKPKIYLTDHERIKAKEYLQSNGIDLSKPLYMIGVLGSGISKTYPFDYMAEVLDSIVNLSEDCQILFNYIPKQKEDAKSIYELCSKQTQGHIFFEVFGSSLREFLAIAGQCSALIGNEGGATNMAKAVAIPTFTIFSPWIIKEAWNMFDDGETHVSVHLNDYQPEIISALPPKKRKENWANLYERFQPHFFSNVLTDFIVNVENR